MWFHEEVSNLSSYSLGITVPNLIQYRIQRLQVLVEVCHLGVVNQPLSKRSKYTNSNITNHVQAANTRKIASLFQGEVREV
jgi:hypothetical protein